MSEPFLGEIRMVGFYFNPRGWALCNGQLLSIAQNSALFSLLGTNYGGDGQNTFGLPDLRGRTPINYGQGPGLSPYDIGSAGGSESVTLTTNQMPIHNHFVNAVSGVSTTDNPNGVLAAIPGLSTDGTAVNAYSNAASNTTMSPSAIQNAGGGQSHPNIQPYLAVNFVIALEGIFPPRP